MQPRRTRARAGPRHRAGFTLVEVLVAVLVLAIGLVALARASAQAIGALGDARAEGDAAWRAARRLDALRALPCADRIGGATRDAAAVERWTVVPRMDSAATELTVVITPTGRRAASTREYTTVAPC